MNVGKLNQKLEKFLEDFVSVNYEDLPDMRSLLGEFFEDKSKGVPHYQWKLIPKEQYHNALKMYMRDGKDFKFPKRILEDWLNLILYNVTILDIMTELAGHTSYFDYYTLNDIFYGDDVVIVDYDSAYEVLEKEGFYDWAVLPDGTDAISDYGRKPIYDILGNLPDFPSSEEIIIAINRCLDIVHCRGDLASAFIEGGAKSCYQISNESLNEQHIQLKLPFEGNFKAWFKNSKCVDENGNPLVVYHGTNNKFSKFSKDKIGSKTDAGWAGKGFYFHVDKDTASVYGDNVMACYLSIQNPFDFNNGKSINDNIRDMGIDPETDNHWDPIEVREERVSGKITEWLKKNGYDGAKLWGQWMVLEPWQIKSINNNEPTFSDDINETLEKVRGVEYLYNPTKSELQGLLNKSKNEVRGILMVDTDELYIWNAYEYTHSYIDSLLGLKGFRIEFRIEDNWLIGNGPDGLLCKEFLEILSQSRVMDLDINLFDPLGYLQ